MCVCVCVCAVLLQITCLIIYPVKFTQEVIFLMIHNNSYSFVCRVLVVDWAFLLLVVFFVVVHLSKIWIYVIGCVCLASLSVGYDLQIFQPNSCLQAPLTTASLYQF